MQEQNRSPHQVRRFVIIFIIVGVIAAGVFGMLALSGLKKEPPSKPREVAARRVKTLQVEYRDLISPVSGSGRLVSRNQADVLSEAQGVILPGDIPLKKGQEFRSGAVLFRIYDEQARYSLLAAKSRFLNAAANLLPDFKVDFPESYAAWSAFLGAIDIHKNLPPLPEIRGPREKIFLSGRGLLSDYYSIKSEEIRVSKYTVTAPFSGAFMEVFLETGATANSGSKIARIIRTDSLEIEVPLKIQDAQRIPLQSDVQLFDESGKNSGQGRVIRKAAFVDPASQSVSVFVEARQDPANPLLPGVYLRARFPNVRVPGAMQLPRNAVFNSDEVFIVANGKLAKHTISIHKTDEQSILFSGLEPGVLIVAEPLVNASENQPVISEPLPAPQAETK